VVIAYEGRIITNAHICLEGPNKPRDKLGVRLWNDKLVIADIVWVGRIKKYDLCLIDANDWYFVKDEFNIKLLQNKDYIPPVNLKKQSVKWTPAHFSNKEPKIGQPVMHIGNMGQVRELISFGTIGRIAPGWNEQKAYSYIGNSGPGSSGGGVFTLDGDLIGLMYSGYSIIVPGRFMGVRIPQGVGHIIPYDVIEYALAK
jgi:hypothetical protein